MIYLWFFIVLLIPRGFADSALELESPIPPPPSQVGAVANEESTDSIVPLEPSVTPDSPIPSPVHSHKESVMKEKPAKKEKPKKSIRTKKPAKVPLRKSHFKPVSKKSSSHWLWFKWLRENHISLEWAYGILDQEDKNLYAPPLLKEKISKNFKNEALLYLNFHRNIIRFPYVLDWGLRGSIGLARNYDIKSDYFFPLSLSGIISVRIYDHQAIIPFLEGGISSWNRNISSDFSEVFPFWNVGALLSLSLFKPALRYVFANDYGVQDIGFILEWKNHLSPFQKEERGVFLKTFHLGLYCHF